MKRKGKEDDDQHDDHTTRNIINNYKHKRKKMRTTKIMTKRIMGSCNQKRRGRRPRSKPQPRVIVVESTRER